MPDESYGWRMTPAGLALVAAAIAAGAPVAISTLVLGDGGGIIPPATAPGIVREVWRAPVASVRRATDNPLLVEVQAVVPASAGPFVIREAALLSADGTVVALCRRPDLYKGGPGEAHVIDLLARIVVSDAAVVTIAVDSGLYATLAAVDAALATHAAHGTHPAATTSQFGFTRLATDAEVAALSAPDRVVTPASLAPLFGRVHAVNGYQRLPGGLIFQWGYGNAGSSGPTVTFPVAYPSACYGVFSGDEGATPYNQSFTNISTTGFRWWSALGTDASFWFSIGR